MTARRESCEVSDDAPFRTGSIVCGLSHSPHRVAPMAADAPTRYGSIMAYKCAERPSGICWPPGALPPVWALAAKRGELPPVLVNLFRNAYDRELTGGRIWSSDPTEDHLEAGTGLE